MKFANFAQNVKFSFARPELLSMTVTKKSMSTKQQCRYVLTIVDKLHIDVRITPAVTLEKMCA